MDVGQYVDQLERAGDQLTASARFAGLDTQIPSCPEWTVGQLVRHTTRVHHWVTFILGGGAQDGFTFDRPDDADLFAVFVSGLDELAAALRTAPASLDVYTMIPAETAALSWARRQAHETAIHRVDAELAADAGVSEFDADFAADGLAELVMLLGPHRFNTAGLTRACTVTLTPVDANLAWTVTLSPSGVTAVDQAKDDSDLTLFATASDLYRWAWNRARDDEVSLAGDVTVADLWRQYCQVTARRS